MYKTKKLLSLIIAILFTFNSTVAAAPMQRDTLRQLSTGQIAPLDLATTLAGGRTSASPKTILLVEDDPNVCRVVEDFLAFEGFQVEVAHHGQHGIERLQEMHADGGQIPDIVLLDVKMPVMNGVQFARAVRTDDACSQFKDVPILVFANGISEDHRTDLHHIGVAGFADKTDQQRLLGAIKSNLPLPIIAGRGKSSSSGQQAANGEDTIIELDLMPDLREMMQGDKIPGGLGFLVLQKAIEGKQAEVDRFFGFDAFSGNYTLVAEIRDGILTPLLLLKSQQPGRESASSPQRLRARQVVREMTGTERSPIDFVYVDYYPFLNLSALDDLLESIGKQTNGRMKFRTNTSDDMHEASIVWEPQDARKKQVVQKAPAKASSSGAQNLKIVKQALTIGQSIPTEPSVYLVSFIFEQALQVEDVPSYSNRLLKAVAGFKAAAQRSRLSARPYGDFQKHDTHIQIGRILGHDPTHEEIAEIYTAVAESRMPVASPKQAIEEALKIARTMSGSAQVDPSTVSIPTLNGLVPAMQVAVEAAVRRIITHPRIAPFFTGVTLESFPLVKGGASFPKLVIRFTRTNHAVRGGFDGFVIGPYESAGKRVEFYAYALEDPKDPTSKKIPTDVKSGRTGAELSAAVGKLLFEAEPRLRQMNQGSGKSSSASSVKSFAKQLLPNSAPIFTYQGENYTVQPRWVPKGIKDNDMIIDEEQLLQLALTDGWKVVLTENDNTMTYGALYIVVKLMEMAGKEYSNAKGIPGDPLRALGLATGGTTEPLRKALGLMDLCKKIVGSSISVEDRKIIFETLDDYYWPKGSDKKKMELGAYRNEQKYMFLRNLLGLTYEDPFPEEMFISPEIDTELTLEEAAAKFRQEMEMFIDVCRIIVQLHGIGSCGHDGFNEVFTLLAQLEEEFVFDVRKHVTVPDGALKMPDHSWHEHTGLLRPDHATPLLDITAPVQNIGHMGPPFHKFFLKFMSDNYLFNMKLLIDKIQTRQPEEWLTHYDDPIYQFDSVDDFFKELQHVLNNLDTVPRYAITQGTGDVLRRSRNIALRESNTPTLNLIMVCSGQKEKPFHGAVDFSPSEANTSSSIIQMSENSLVLGSMTAAGSVDKSKTFMFIPASKEAAALATEENIQQKWEKTPEGRRVTALLDERAKTITKASSPGNMPKRPEARMTARGSAAHFSYGESVYQVAEAARVEIEELIRNEQNRDLQRRLEAFKGSDKVREYMGNDDEVTTDDLVDYTFCWLNNSIDRLLQIAFLIREELGNRRFEVSTHARDLQKVSKPSMPNTLNDMAERIAYRVIGSMLDGRDYVINPLLTESRSSKFLASLSEAIKRRAAASDLASEATSLNSEAVVKIEALRLIKQLANGDLEVVDPQDPLQKLLADTAQDEQLLAEVERAAEDGLIKLYWESAVFGIRPGLQANTERRSQVPILESPIDGRRHTRTHIDSFGLDGAHATKELLARWAVGEDLKIVNEWLKERGLFIYVADALRSLEEQAFKKDAFIRRKISELSASLPEEEREAAIRNIHQTADRQFCDAHPTAAHLSGGALDLEIHSAITGRRLPTKPWDYSRKFRNKTTAQLPEADRKWFDLARKPLASYKPLEDAIAEADPSTASEWFRVNLGWRRFRFHILTRDKNSFGILNPGCEYSPNSHESWHFERGTRSAILLKYADEDGNIPQSVVDAGIGAYYDFLEAGNLFVEPVDPDVLRQALGEFFASLDDRQYPLFLHTQSERLPEAIDFTDPVCTAYRKQCREFFGRLSEFIEHIPVIAGVDTDAIHFILNALAADAYDRIISLYDPAVSPSIMSGGYEGRIVVSFDIRNNKGRECLAIKVTSNGIGASAVMGERKAELADEYIYADRNDGKGLIMSEGRTQILKGVFTPKIADNPADVTEIEVLIPLVKLRLKDQADAQQQEPSSIPPQDFSTTSSTGSNAKSTSPAKATARQKTDRNKDGFQATLVKQPKKSLGILIVSNPAGEPILIYNRCSSFSFSKDGKTITLRSGRIEEIYDLAALDAARTRISAPHTVAEGPVVTLENAKPARAPFALFSDLGTKLTGRAKTDVLKRYADATGQAYGVFIKPNAHRYEVRRLAPDCCLIRSLFRNRDGFLYANRPRPFELVQLGKSRKASSSGQANIKRVNSTGYTAAIFTENPTGTLCVSNPGRELILTHPVRRQVLEGDKLDDGFLFSPDGKLVLVCEFADLEKQVFALIDLETRETKGKITLPLGYPRRSEVQWLVDSKTLIIIYGYTKQDRERTSTFGVIVYNVADLSTPVFEQRDALFLEAGPDASRVTLRDISMVMSGRGGDPAADLVFSLETGEQILGMDRGERSPAKATSPGKRAIDMAPSDAEGAVERANASAFGRVQQHVVRKEWEAVAGELNTLAREIHRLLKAGDSATHEIGGFNFIISTLTASQDKVRIFSLSVLPNLSLRAKILANKAIREFMEAGHIVILPHRGAPVPTPRRSTDLKPVVALIATAIGPAVRVAEAIGESA